MAATAAMIAEGGLANLSMRSIAKVAGLTQGAIYVYFPSKEILYWATIARGYALLSEHQARALKTPQPEERLMNVSRAYRDFALEKPQFYKALHTNPEPHFKRDEAPGHLTSVSMQPFQTLVSVVEDAQAAGVLRKEDSFNMAMTVWSTVHGSISIFQAGAMLTNRDGFFRQFDESLHTLLQGLANPSRD